jgi:hypothetical protein
MRHDLGCRFVIARQGVEPDVDPWRENETVVIKGRAVRENDMPGLWVDTGRSLRDDVDPFPLNCIKLELLRLDRTQACKHGVAEGAGGVDCIGFDKSYG